MGKSAALSRICNINQRKKKVLFMGVLVSLFLDCLNGNRRGLASVLGRWMILGSKVRWKI